MRVVALLTVRNEELFIAKCLEHLHAQGIEVCLIDNGSTDRTLEIATRFLGRSIFRIEHLPFNGTRELQLSLLNEERLAREIEADWFIHHDADEIRQAPAPHETLLEAIQAVDHQGYNAINFDEFVFLPTSDDESFVNKDYVQEMQHYYFFQPKPLHRLNAWKKNDSIDLHSQGGHQVQFSGQKIYPNSFVLRHYIALSRSHAIAKYGSRIFSKDNLSKGWGGSRVTFVPSQLNFPNRDQLKQFNNNYAWDKSDVWTVHTFIGTSRDSYYPQNLTLWQNKVKSENYPPMPIIIGAGRSGTTLLRLMLDAHPDLTIPSETHFIPELTQLEGAEEAIREQFYNLLIHHPRWAEFHIAAKDLKEESDKIQPFTISEGLRAFYRLYAARFKKQRWGEKTPSYGRHLLTVKTLLPEAHFIHIIRDGRDVALSLKSLWFSPGQDIETLAVDWVWKVREAKQQAQLCPHYLEIHYENLVTDPVSTLKQICEFINLPYKAEMLEYHKTALNRLNEFSDHPALISKEERLAIFQNTTKPPDTSRIERWKTEMCLEDRKKFEQIAGTMLRDLGYSTESSLIIEPEQQNAFLSSLQQVKQNLLNSQAWLQNISAELQGL
ncbi:MAG TPA: sulfotransferase [Trichocoleus sp.]|jgi:glycosyltransferase involved in cell wall biosynthesis